MSEAREKLTVEICRERATAFRASAAAEPNDTKKELYLALAGRLDGHGGRLRKAQVYIARNEAQQTCGAFIATKKSKKKFKGVRREKSRSR